MSIHGKVTCSVLIFLVGFQVTAHAANFKTIAFPDSLTTEVTGINAQGDMVGFYLDNAGVQHGFVDRQGVFTAITVPRSLFTNAYGINDYGQIVGRYQDSASAIHGFLFDGTTFSTIDYPGANYTSASGINNAGEIVGDYYLRDDVFHGYVFSNGSFTTLDPPGNFNGVRLLGLNHSGGIVGVAAPNRFYLGVRYGGGVFKQIQFPGSLATLAYGLSDNGVVVGGYLTTSVLVRCFTLVNGRYHTLTFPHAQNMSCQGVNTSGRIVGWWDDGHPFEHGFLITP